MDIESSETIRQQQHAFISRAQVSAIMFSNERLFMEQRKYVEMKHEAEKVIQKYIKSCEKERPRRSVYYNRVAIYQSNESEIYFQKFNS